MDRRSSSAHTSSPRSRPSATGSRSCGPARLVEIDTIADLRQLRRTIVEISHLDSGPTLQGIAGVSNVERVNESRLRFSLSGPPAAALRALAAADITALTMREPTLEEIFLDYYGQPAP